jgi:hypothetical protein
MLVSAMPPPRAWPSPVDQSLSRCHRRRGCRLDDRGARSTVNRPAARASHSRHLDSGSELRARVVNANGTREPYVTIAATTADRTSGYARMVPQALSWCSPGCRRSQHRGFERRSPQCGNGESV